MPRWWNWQTRTFKGRVPRGVGVRVSPAALSYAPKYVATENSIQDSRLKTRRIIWDMSQNIDRIISVQIEKHDIKTGSRGDDSFSQELQIAQESLENSNQINTYSRLQEILSNLLPLEIKFSKPSKEISENKVPSHLEKIEESLEPSGNQKPYQKNDNNNFFIVEETDKIKEALAQNLPKFYFPLSAFSPLYTEQMQMSNLSSINLQILIDEIVKQAKLIKTQNKTNLELLLNEETLGTILLSLTSQKGKIVIQIAALPEIKKLLDKEINKLEESLERAKIDVEEIKVTEVKKYDSKSAG